MIPPRHVSPGQITMRIQSTVETLPVPPCAATLLCSAASRSSSLWNSEQCLHLRAPRMMGSLQKRHGTRFVPGWGGSSPRGGRAWWSASALGGGRLVREGWKEGWSRSLAGAGAAAVVLVPAFLMAGLAAIRAVMHRVAHLNRRTADWTGAPRQTLVRLHQFRKIPKVASRTNRRLGRRPWLR